MVFDSLTYARRLKAAGFTEAQAEALADSNRELVVSEFAIKTDLTALRQELTTIVEHQTLRITVRMGIMLAASFSLMTAIIGALIKFH